MKLGMIGQGKIGSNMAQRLLAAGHAVAVWGRSEERAGHAVRHEEGS